MAYTKIKCIKSATHLQTSVDYITNPMKTNDKVYVGSYMCSTDYAVRDFYSVLSMAIKKGNNVAHHICQSFSPEENITPQQALGVGRELIKRMYPNHQYVIATHIDRNHIHNHIIVCAVNFQTYRKLHSNKDSLEKMRNISNEICKENGLSIIEPTNKSHRIILREVIDKAVGNSNSFEEFLAYMQAENYEIKQGKYLYFKKKSDRNFINTASIGTAYTENKLKLRIFGTPNIENHQKNIYDDKIVRMSYRKRLKNRINMALKRAQDYDDFIRIMRENDYTVKFGKHLAFKHITGERFIRCESLGTDYTEYMLKLYFENPDEYQKLKEEISGKKIDRLINPQDKSMNSWQASVNVDIEIRMLNFLRENGITSYDDLIVKLDNAKKLVDINERNISHFNLQIAEKNEIKKAIRTYWQYKPYWTEFNSINNVAKKENYRIDHSEILAKCEAAIDLLNKSKLPDGTLPKAADLNEAVERIEKMRNHIIERNQRVKAELQRYENMKHNLDDIIKLHNEEPELIEAARKTQQNRFNHER